MLAQFCELLPNHPTAWPDSSYSAIMGKGQDAPDSPEESMVDMFCHLMGKKCFLLQVGYVFSCRSKVGIVSVKDVSILGRIITWKGFLNLFLMCFIFKANFNFFPLLLPEYKS